MIFKVISKSLENRFFLTIAKKRVVCDPQPPPLWPPNLKNHHISSSPNRPKSNVPNQSRPFCRKQAQTLKQTKEVLG